MPDGLVLWLLDSRPPSMSLKDSPLSASAPLMASSFSDSSVRPSLRPWTVV
jgi:hypothetical protein